MATTGHRTLADQLRSWSDERLSRLLRERPDLATPAPHDSGQLASRAATRSSVLRALDQLTRFELCVLDALVVVGQTSREGLAEVVRATPSAVLEAADRLVDLVLAWESTQGLRPLSTVAEALPPGSPGTSGLHPVSPEAPAPAVVRRMLDELSPAARGLLDHVLASGGTATSGTARQTVLPEDAETPAEELLARRLLLPRGGAGVVLPGEVGIALRGGRTTADPVDEPPAVATSAREPSLVDRAAAGAAFEAVRRVELVLDQWGLHPPTALRSGGLGVRDLRATAVDLHVDEPTAALLVEVASAAGLLSTAAAPDGTPCWIPTDAFDRWTAAPTAERWLTLVRAWLDSPRMSGLVGGRDPAGKVWNALAPELASPHQVEARRMALDALRTLPVGEVLATGTGVPSVVAQLEWRRPRRPRTRADQVVWALDEATALGVSALGGLASYAATLLDDRGDDAAAALAALLPPPVDHVLLQADLTAIAPGPLESQLARRLQLVADVESRGGATVYRFTPESVRRAFDTGWTAAEVHDFVGSVSRTPVPQPLSYLVDDTARTFGTIRVGHAEAFLRADDDTALTELLHHPKAGTLGLRRIAPTVLVSSTPLDVLLPRLRDLGVAPVVEAAYGTVHVARPDLLRARTPKEQRGRSVAAARETARVAQVVTAIRAGDRAESGRPAQATTTLSPSGSMAALREAIEAGESVLIGYVDNHGTSTDRLVDPVALEGGTLTAHDHRSDDTRTFAVHRITTVRAVPADA
ncbi:helicase-associated domain-containing protein [Nocardioides mangrovi]|uniref:Helicase-associated domain-containing protein n=1 Tax=Nocardioides mangrovi TaxID=2874580 RepID=A0ABS7UEZ4_9ACTN|nr:helicase C-terminal domain-containing protein [Nocardioides mangrovi]MBZ5739579.1 helicase-associated domain-containing protein [Nocardioides mangrovi]